MAETTATASASSAIPGAGATPGSAEAHHDVPPPFEPAALPENCVEYMVFVIDQQLDSRKLLSSLDTVKKSASQLVQGLTKDYIWQRDAFNLELKSHQGLLYLHGITDYGDSVEDEWLIVYMLRELSKSFANVWVRVFDSDGEFLLIEAANVAPKWLNPEMDGNRVWINQGKLLLIPLAAESVDSTSISLANAVGFIRSDPTALVHSAFVESEAFYRLEKYPRQISDSIHCSLVTIPRKLAYVLHDRPKAIAPAVEAFYLRDPISLKPLMASSPPQDLEFPPEDLVTVSVRFTKVLFAQLKSQRFDPPPAWAKLLPPAASDDAEAGAEPHSERARLELGMKVTVGFELLAARADQSRSRIAREVAIVLEDLKEDGADALPSDADIRSWKDVDRDDDEAWLDINYEDFERELDGKAPAGNHGKSNAGFGDANAQADLRKIVERFEAFLNDDDAGIDGAEMDDMDIDDDDDDSDSSEDSDEEDKEVSFDEEEFARMMREMMGLPASDTAAGKTPARSPAATAKQSQDDEEIRAIQELAAQMEAELNEYGALKLDPTPKKLAALKGKATDRGEASSSKGHAQEAEDDEDDEEDEGELDIDYNLAKNLLESFKSQAGLAGPAGNIMGMMGMGLPRDEDEDNSGDK